MTPASTLGTFALALSLEEGESIWVVDDSLIGADDSIEVTQKKPSPGATRIAQFQKNNFSLHQNLGHQPALLIVGGPLNSHLTALGEDAGALVVRATSLVAVDDQAKVRSHEPIFNGHPDYEPMDWAEFQQQRLLIISGSNDLFGVPIDGEYLVDVDTIVAYNSTLKITPVAADGTSAAKRLAGLHQPIYRFTGRGNIWCQAGRTREFGRLLRPLLKGTHQ